MIEYKIKLPAKAVKFIQERTRDLALYSKRGGSKEEDLLVGVYAELAAYKYLRNQDIPVSRPDFSIHTKKSFGADLVDADDRKYHVKGQSIGSSEKYGHSWIFQKSDRIVKNQKSIEGEWIICCSVNVETEIVKILLDIPVKYCRFGACRLKCFQESKVALYLGDQL